MSDNPNPFSSPEANIERLPQAAPVVPFRSGHTRAFWTVIFLAICAVLDVVGAASTYSEIQLLNRGLEEGIDEQAAESNDMRQMVVGVLQTTAFLFAAVAFLMWIHRAHSNLPALGARRLQYSPGWTVGYFFIPILNLFRPYQATKEIWKGSDPEAAFSERAGLSQIGTPATLPMWWAFWIAANLAGRASARMSLRAETLDEMVTSSWVTLVADVISAVAAVLAISVVLGIDRNQEQKATALGLLNDPFRPQTPDFASLTS